MILSGKDLIVIAAGAAIIAAGAAGLYIDYTSRLATDRSDQIGTITFKKKTAERKYNDQMIWEDIGKESPIFNNDTIRTAEGSSAVVNLADGTKIDLDENTLVMLSLTSSGADIDLAGGSIFANASEGGASKGSLNIRSGTTAISVKGGALNLTKTAEKALDVSVASGTATVAGATGPVSVGANQILQVSAGKAEVRKVSVMLDSPAPNAYILNTGGTAGSVSFSWKGETGKAALEIASDRSFSKSLVKKAGTSGMTERLAKGDYYWRVTGAGGASDVRKFTVIEDSVVSPLSPSEGENLAFRPGASRVAFTWSGSRFASSYRIEVSKDALFTSIASSMTSMTTAAAAENLPEGSYYWRVVPVYEFMNPRISPKIASFKVSSKSEVSVPVPVYPEDGSKVSTVAVSGGGFSFGWGRLPDCDSYKLEIARDEAFREIVSADSAAGNFIAKSLPAQEALYYWRVTGHAPDGALSRPSVTRRLYVEKPHPPTQLAAQQENVSSVGFRWKDPDALGRYRVEISKGRDFSAVFKSAETSVSSATVGELAQGDYSWRVCSLDIRGNVVGTSGAERFTVSGFIDKPVLVYPVDNVRLNVMRMKTLDFTWKENREITAYELEVHQYSFVSDKLVYKAEVTGAKHSINPFSVLSVGTFYWQVTALKKSGGEVLARSAPVRGYFNIPAGPELRAPKIGNMKVYVE